MAQVIEIGGHCEVFEPDAQDDLFGAMAFTRLLVRGTGLAVIAAGGIMDGAGTAAAHHLGAIAAQLGTRLVAVRSRTRAPDGAGWARRATHSHNAVDLGRPARALAHRFTALAAGIGDQTPPNHYLAYDAKQALHAAGARGSYGFGARWAGQEPPLARLMAASELMTALAEAIAAARGSENGGFA